MRTTFAKEVVIGVLLGIVASILSISIAHASHLCPTEPGCTTGKLNVPGDFPPNTTGEFSMYLLSGNLSLGAAGGPQIGQSSLGNLRQIDFTVSAFDHIGPGYGTSTLSLNVNDYVIGQTQGLPNVPPDMIATFYIDGVGTGGLVDNATSTAGHWTLNVPMWADFNSETHDLGLVSITTNATYNTAYGPIAGSMMNYHDGVAGLVAQTTVQSGVFAGLTVSFELSGLDPLAESSSPVPLPGALWLFASGIIGMLGVSVRRQWMWKA